MTSCLNTVARLRRERSWSQEELAARAGVSRAEVSAIENHRLVPSTATALQLAAALGRRVDDLFSLPAAEEEAPGWAWSPERHTTRYWEARVGGRHLRYPVEPTALGVLPHDGVFQKNRWQRTGVVDPDRTLILVGCDPAVGLLAATLARIDGIRLAAFTRSSYEALTLLGQGVVQVAGIHWSGRRQGANTALVRRMLGNGYRLLHLARWEEGVAVAPSVRARTLRELVRGPVQWIGREKGSGARRCLDRLLGERRPRARFRLVATDHRAVAQAIRAGWAQAGVAVRLVADEAGVEFFSVQREDYELCYPETFRGDARLVALRRALRSKELRDLLTELPGYDARRTGEERAVV